MTAITALDHHSSKYRTLLKQYNNLFLPVNDCLPPELRLNFATELFNQMQKLYDDNGLSSSKKENFLNLLKPEAMEYNRLKGLYGKNSDQSNESGDLRIKLKRHRKSIYDDQETVMQLFIECNSKPEAENKDSNKEEYYHLLGVYGRINLHLEFKKDESAEKGSQVVIANGDERKNDLLRAKQVYEKLKQIADKDPRFKEPFDTTMTPAQLEYRALWSQYGYPNTSSWTTHKECQRGTIYYEESQLLHHELTIEFPKRHPEECPTSHPAKFRSFSPTRSPQDKFERDLKLALSSNFSMKYGLIALHFLTALAEQHKELKACVDTVMFDTLEREFINPYNFEETLHESQVILNLEELSKGNESLEARVKLLKSPEMIEFKKLLVDYLKTSSPRKAITDQLDKFIQAYPQFKSYLDQVRERISYNEEQRALAVSAKIDRKRERDDLDEA